MLGNLLGTNLHFGLLKVSYFKELFIVSDAAKGPLHVDRGNVF